MLKAAKVYAHGRSMSHLNVCLACTHEHNTARVNNYGEFFNGFPSVAEGIYSGGLDAKPSINYSRILVASKTRKYHGRVGAARRTAGRRGRAGTGRTGTPTGRFAQNATVPATTQNIEAATNIFLFVEPKTRIHHGRVGRGWRVAGWRSGARRGDGTPMGRST